MQGRITKQISNQYTVDVKNELFVCNARGKFKNMGLSPVVGDIVEIDEVNKTIEKILPRKNKLNRPVVANVDTALIVTSVKKPDLSLSLLDKQLTIVISNDIEPIIILTKLDLLDKQELKSIKKIMKYYEKLGIKVIPNTKLNKLKRLLKENVVVLTGQTGAGKSSILNKLDKNLHLETKPISEALNRGVHTTRHTELYKINHMYMVDTPGFSALDLTDISIDNLREAFKEFDKYTCAYKDCTHNNEKKCGVKEALEKELILPSRYNNYIRFLKEIYESSSKLYK